MYLFSECSCCQLVTWLTPLTRLCTLLQTFEYQDAIGSSLLAIVDSVPAGVLCFLPSYRLLDKVWAR
jgi:hypothetical protein